MGLLSSQDKTAPKACGRLLLTRVVHCQRGGGEHTLDQIGLLFEIVFCCFRLLFGSGEQVNARERRKTETHEKSMFV